MKTSMFDPSDTCLDTYLGTYLHNVAFVKRPVLGNMPQNIPQSKHAFLTTVFRKRPYRVYVGLFIGLIHEQGLCRGTVFHRQTHGPIQGVRFILVSDPEQHRLG